MSERGLYSGIHKTIGTFASHLEFMWHLQFRKWGWNAEYIGLHCPYADFQVGEVKIEVKPYGDRFVSQACSRAGHVLIVEGAPGFAKWWFVDHPGQAMQIDASPRSTPFACIYGTERHMETPQEFMDRCGLKFTPITTP